MKIVLLSTLFIGLSLICYSQNQVSYKDSLIHEIGNASSLQAKVLKQRSLIEYEIGSGNKASADSIIDHVFAILEEANDTETLTNSLLLFADLGKARFNYYKKAIEWAERGLELARSKKRVQFQTAFKARLASLHTMSANWGKVTEYTNEAMAGVEDIADDSLKSTVYLDISGAFFSRYNFTQVYRYAIKALRSAEKSRAATEQYYSLSLLTALYRELKDYEKSKEYALRSLEIARKITDNTFLAEAYSSLSNTCRLQGNFQAAEQYALLQLETGRRNQNMGGINGAVLSLIYEVYVPANNFDGALKTVEQYPQVRQYINDIFQGLDVSDQIRMKKYQFEQRYDSVAYYYEKTIRPMAKTAGESPWAFQLIEDGGVAYLKMKNYARGIAMLEEAYRAAIVNFDYQTASSVSGQLDTAFRETGKFERALFFNGEYHRFKDTLLQLKQSRDLALAEVNAEEERLAEIAREEQLQTKQRHNLQYIFITSLLVASFFVLVLLGFFKVSAGVIRFAGFFSFLFLFEFIFLLLKKQLYGFTYGEPWRELLMMILLAAALLPLHHLLEHKLIHYLSHHRMILTGKIRIKALFKKKKPEIQVDPDNI